MNVDSINTISELSPLLSKLLFSLNLPDPNLVVYLSFRSRDFSVIDPFPSCLMEAMQSHD